MAYKQAESFELTVHLHEHECSAREPSCKQTRRLYLGPGLALACLCQGGLAVGFADGGLVKAKVHYGHLAAGRRSAASGLQTARWSITKAYKARKPCMQM